MGRVKKKKNIKFKKSGPGVQFGGGRGSAEIGGGPHFYCYFWGIKLRWYFF